MAYTPPNPYARAGLDGKTVVLAYSGGLDTSFCTAYFTRVCHASVAAVCVDTGGFSEEKKKQNEARAKRFGAASYALMDGRQALFDHFIKYLIFGNVLRGGTYPLCAGVERYVIAQECVKAANAIQNAAGAGGAASGATMAAKKGAGHSTVAGIAHGSTGAGNDQVRIDAALSVLAPQWQALAPIRDLAVSRAQELEWLAAQGLPTDFLSKQYSINQGLWGVTIGGGETKGPMGLPPDEAYLLTRPMAGTPDEAAQLEVGFEKGVPVSLNGKKMAPLQLIDALNAMAGAHGYGRGVHVGDTILGIKGRVAFEAPAALALIAMHRELEKLVLTKWQAGTKEPVANTYGALMHEGLYYDPAMRDAEALLTSSQQRVSGNVRAKLHKGSLTIIGAESPYSLLNTGVATYGEENALWNGEEAAGFSKLWGLQGRLAAIAKQNAEREEKGTGSRNS